MHYYEKFTKKLEKALFQNVKESRKKLLYL